MRIRRALLAAAVALVLGGPFAAAEEPTAPSVNVNREMADRFLAAFRAKDEAAMAFIRDRPVSPAREAFLVADDLLRRHAEGSLREPPEPGDFLAAARALADHVKDLPEDAALPALVDGWARLGPEDLRRELDLRRIHTALEEAQHRNAPLEERLDLTERAPAPAGITGTALLMSRAELLSDLGRTDAAVVAWDEARRSAADRGWTYMETAALWKSAYARYRRGDLADARTRFRDHLAVVEARFSRWARPEALRWVAAAEAGLGNYPEALDLMRRSLEEARSCGEAWQEAQSTEFLGRMHGSLGHYAEALDLLEKAHAMYLALPDGSRLGVANSLDAMGAIWTEIGRPDRAVPVLKEALAGLELIGYPGEAARARSNLGAAYEALGRGDDALRAMEQALADWEALHDRLGAARTLALLGDLHLRASRLDRGLEVRQNCLDRALEVQERCLEMMEAMGNKPGAERAKLALGEIRFAMGEYDVAYSIQTRAIDYLHMLGDRRGEVRAQRDLAATCRALHRADRALAAARANASKLMAIGCGLGEEEAAGLRRDIQSNADTGLMAAWELGGSDPRAIAGAFHLAESSRGLLLAEGMVNRDALLAADVPAPLREAEAAARGRVAALAKSMEDPEALVGAYRDLEHAVDRIHREARRVADVVYPQPIALADFQASLPATDALALYQVTPERAFAIVVTRDSAEMLDLGESKALAAAVAAYVDLVSVDGSEEGARAAALYDALLRPVEKAVGDRTRLLVCPDGPLSFLPFEALLRVEGEKQERAVERWEMAYVPSATVLAIQRAGRETPGTGILAVGDPVYPGESGTSPAGRRDAEIRGMGILRRLPGTAAEVRGIAALAPAGAATLLLRERASGAALREALAGAKGRLGALHLACHGHLDAERPRLTGLVLAGGEILGLDDIYRMKVPADLVVLSACASARGRILDGEGAMGLARGFFYAGARRVVVSDWAVSDEATRALMESFYRRMLREGRPPAGALRAAKIEALRSGGPLAHPAHWAAFVLWGD